MGTLKMFIYPTEMNPAEAAKALDDRSILSGCLSVAQILCSALYRENIWNLTLYKPNCEDSDWAVWAAHSKNNFRWLYHYGQALCEEYKWRWERQGEPEREHGSRIIMGNAWDVFKKHHHVFPNTEMTDMPNTTEVKGYLDATDAYQTHLLDVIWNPQSCWTRRGKPWWWHAVSLAKQALSDELSPEQQKLKNNLEMMAG